MMKQYYYILILTLIFSINALFEPPNINALTEDDSFIFSWSLNKNEKLIKLNLDVKTLGWVGIGISEHENIIQNSQLLIAKMQNGIAEIQHPTEIGYLQKKNSDEKDSCYYDIEGKVQNGRSYLSLTRKFDNGIKNCLKIKEGQNYFVTFYVRHQGLVHQDTFAKKIILNPIPNSTPTDKELSDNFYNKNEINQTINNNKISNSQLQIKHDTANILMEQYSKTNLNEKKEPKMSKLMIICNIIVISIILIFLYTIYEKQFGKKYCNNNENDSKKFINRTEYQRIEAEYILLEEI